MDRATNQHDEHGKLVQDILLALGQRPDVFLWRNPTGHYLALDGVTHVVVGIKGAPDIMGVKSCGGVGRAFGIEAKTGSGRVRKRQSIWRAAFEKRHGIYIVARSVIQAVSAINAMEPVRAS